MKVEKNVPVPPSQHKGSIMRESKYPFDKMDIGDSFYFETKKYSKKEIINKGISICANGFQRAKLRGEKRRYIYRTIKDGIRVWRIK